jgi:hypothetical protein
VAKRIHIPGLPEKDGVRSPMDTSVAPITITITDNDELVEVCAEDSSTNFPPPQPLPIRDAPIDPSK